MIGRTVALCASGVLLAGTAGASGRGVPPAPPANICSTQWGWCDLSPVAAPPGLACFCLTADNVQVSGTTRFFPHTGTASPYLRPHTTGVPPQTDR